MSAPHPSADTARPLTERQPHIDLWWAVPGRFQLCRPDGRMQCSATNCSAVNTIQHIAKTKWKGGNSLAHHKVEVPFQFVDGFESALLRFPAKLELVKLEIIYHAPQRARRPDVGVPRPVYCVVIMPESHLPLRLKALRSGYYRQVLIGHGDRLVIGIDEVLQQLVHVRRHDGVVVYHHGGAADFVAQ